MSKGDRTRSQNVEAGDGRKKRRWKVTLSTEDGAKTINRDVLCYWSPAWEGIKQAVGITAAAEQIHEDGGAWGPIAVELVG